MMEFSPRAASISTPLSGTCIANTHLVSPTVLNNIPITNPAMCSAYYVGYSTRGHSLVKLWPSKLFPWHRPPDQGSVGNSTDQYPCYYFISLYNTSHVLGCDSTCLPGSAKQVESVRAGVCRGFRPILKPLEQGSRLHFAHRSIPAS